MKVSKPVFPNISRASLMPEFRGVQFMNGSVLKNAWVNLRPGEIKFSGAVLRSFANGMPRIEFREEIVVPTGWALVDYLTINQRIHRLQYDTNIQYCKIMTAGVFANNYGAKDGKLLFLVPQSLLYSKNLSLFPPGRYTESKWEPQTSVPDRIGHKMLVLWETDLHKKIDLEKEDNPDEICIMLAYGKGRVILRDRE